MIRIQFPEFFRSAILVIYAFVTALPVTKGNRVRVENVDDTKDEMENPSVDRVCCEVLYDPPPGMRRGDVIIIHGLHGSTTKTWRQGAYESSKIKKTELRRYLAVASKTPEKQICNKCKLFRKTSLKQQDDDEDMESSDDDASFKDIDSLEASFDESNIDYYIEDEQEYLYDALYDVESMQEDGIVQDDRADNICDSNLVDSGCDNNNMVRASNEARSFRRFLSFLRRENRNISEDMSLAREEKYCTCNNDTIEISTGLIDRRVYEEHLKNHIYGTGSLLLRECIFYVRFFVNFAKQLYALYRRLWDYADEDKDLSNCWPRDWLPLDCPYSRVITINYTTFLWTPIWYRRCDRTSLMEKSLEMARQLESLGVGKQPIVWAAHSKGGLFIKQMFINSWRGFEGTSRDLFLNTHTILFYSVPHHGSVLAHLFTPPLVRPSIEIVEIRTGSSIVQKLHTDFREALEAAQERNESLPLIVSYTETIPTNMSGVLLQIVFPMSADPGVGEFYGLALDHRMICKFPSRNSMLYRDLVEVIKRAYGPRIS